MLIPLISQNLNTMSAIPNSDLLESFAIATSSWVPQPVALTGVKMTAIAGSTNVTLTGLTKDLIKIGDFLWDDVNSQAREVTQIDRVAGWAVIRTGFTNAQTNVDVRVIESRRYRHVRITSTGADSEVDGQIMVNPHEVGRNEQGIRPFFVDSKTSTVRVHATR